MPTEVTVTFGSIISLYSRGYHSVSITAQNRIVDYFAPRAERIARVIIKRRQNPPNMTSHADITALSEMP
jgi:hypothetical protein